MSVQSNLSLRQVSSSLLGLMPVNRQTLIAEKDTKRKASFSHYESFLSTKEDDNTFEQYIENKKKLVDDDMAYQNEFLDGLSDIRSENAEEIERARKETLQILKPMVLERRLFAESKRGLMADYQEELRVPKKRKSNSLEERYERVSSGYVKDTTIFMDKIAGRSGPEFHRGNFKKAVLDYYDGRVSGPFEEYSWCHLTGRAWPKEKVTAAHLVPRSFSDESLRRIFGSEEHMTRSKPKNALLLHKNVERALDKGQIAIVPIACDDVEGPSRWKCILLHNNLRDKILYPTDNIDVCVKYWEIDNKELQFRNDDRPAKRFMYFRFVMSLLQAKRNDHPHIVQELGLDKQTRSFWPSQGEYLSRSTLIEFPRRVSGLEIPESLLDQTTFDDTDQDHSDNAGVNTDTQASIELAEALDEPYNLATGVASDIDTDTEEGI